VGTVRVTDVDVARKRIGLSMKKDGGVSAREARNERGGPQGRGPGKGPHGGKAPSRGQSRDSGNGAMGAALLDAMRKR
jgi:uncharacterized protein